MKSIQPEALDLVILVRQGVPAQYREAMSYIAFAALAACKLA
jgi:hypothetical protein